MKRYDDTVRHCVTLVWLRSVNETVCDVACRNTPVTAAVGLVNGIAVWSQYFSINQTRMPSAVIVLAVSLLSLGACER